MRTRPSLISFAGDENTDPITPAFDKRLGIRDVSLLYGPRLQRRAESLAFVVGEAGLAVTTIPLPHLHRPEHLEAALVSILESRREKAIINISGAPPVVAALALRHAERRNVPVCAVEPDTDRLHWISAPPEYTSFEVAENITLDGYFAAHGLNIISTQAELGDPHTQFDEVASYMLHLAFRSPKSIRSFMSLLPFTPDKVLREVPTGKARSLAEYLASHSLLKRHGIQYRASHQGVERFLTGGWLELAIYRNVIDLFGTGAPPDAAIGLKFASAEGVVNELDVAVLHNNALYVCECKTHSRENAYGVGPAVLFKLHSIVNAHGLGAKPLLVSTMPPTRMELARAQDQEILVLSGTSQDGLRDMLTRWLDL